MFINAVFSAWLMADEGGERASSSPSEEAHVVNVEDKAAKSRRYYAERDATKMYLYN